MEKMYTLAQGGRARIFGYIETASGVSFATGKDLSSTFCISIDKITDIIEHFRDKDWFILGNQVDKVKPNGLGEFFQSNLKMSPKNASHVAAFMVKKGFLQYRENMGILHFVVV